MVGLGDLGGWVLEFLARTPGVKNIVTADINEKWGTSKTNNARLNAAHAGLYPNMSFKKIDLNNLDGAAETIKEIEPDIIYSGVTLQSWWANDELLHGRNLELETGYGPWGVPFNLPLAHKLVKAVRKSGTKPLVVNSSFPDAVNPILGKLGLAPTVGLGNMDLIVPRVQLVVAEKLGVPPNNVKVFMVAHHVSAANLYEARSIGEAPYYMKVLVGDRDVTKDLPPHRIFEEAFPVPTGRSIHPTVASSAVKNMLAMMNDTGELTHAPGPNGLIGGYPVRLSAKGADVFLPEGLEMGEAIRINEEAQKFDGIEKINEDGSVVFTDKAYQMMRDVIGYDCKKLEVKDSEQRAEELRSLYLDFVKKLKH